MAAIDPRTPVMVGGGQHVDRTSAPGQGEGPADLLARAARSALAHAGAAAGAGAVARAIDTLACVRLFADSSPAFASPFGSPANLPGAVARRLGASPRRLVYGPVGGNSPQMLAGHFARAIAAGEAEAVLIAGGEPIRTQSHAAKAGMALDWAEPADDGADEPFVEVPMVSRHELQHGIALPVNVYPLFEVALMARGGLGVEEHRRAMGRLMQNFTRVSAANPWSQTPVERTAEELVRPTADNRMIAWPYTKYLVSNMFVDQSAAILLMSSAAADRLGVPHAHRVYLHGDADVHDHIHVSRRSDYACSPAIRAGAAQALGRAGVGLARLDHIDLYSCFPSAVAIAADEIGLPRDHPRGLTLTGGLAAFGGPGNAYSLHALAEVAQRCRQALNSRGFVFANGGYLTKHAFGVWSSEPRSFDASDAAACQAEVDAVPGPRLEERPGGAGSIETATVVHDRGRPAFGIVVGRQADGARFLARMTEGLDALMADVPVGRPVSVEATDAGNLARLAHA